MLSKSFLSIKAVAVAVILLSGSQLIGFKEPSFASSVFGYDDNPKGKAELFDYSVVLKDLKGTRVPLDQFKGKVIFLNEWATWCGPCRAEMPSIQKIYDALPPESKDKIVFVMLSRDQPDDTPKIIKYITAKAYTFPVFQPTGDLPKQLDSPSIPATWLIAKNGEIVKKEIGIINANEFKNLLESEAKK